MGWVIKSTTLQYRTGYYYQGREIALQKERGKQAKQRFKGNMEYFPEKVKVETATLWAVTRDVEHVHKITDVPRWIIKRWMSEPWWDNVVSQVRKEKNEELDMAMTKVIHKTVEVLQDRVENGEIIRDRKTGEEYRQPVNIQTAARALEVTFKERQLLRGEATNTTVNVSTDKKLEQLAQQFEKMAQGRRTETLEADYVDVSETGEGSETQSETPDRGEESQEGETSEGSWEQIDGLQTEGETETEEVIFTP